MGKSLIIMVYYEEAQRMNNRKRNRLLSVLLASIMSIALLSGCTGKKTEEENTDPIRVYLWTTNLYDQYAPYIQSQLPDVNIEFVVGNNDLDFYKFLDENGGLPDIITCCRFSLHDASPLKDSLLDLSTTNEAGAVYNTYLRSLMNKDGSVNWLPVSADAHGFVVNRGLFEQYDIPLPTDYDSFVSACEAFEEVGIRGFTADYKYDYTCMETLQGVSAGELATSAGRKWRAAYSDPSNDEPVGLDDTVWPGVFERMEQFIQDTHLTAEDLNNNYDTVTEQFQNGQLAMYFGSSVGVKTFREQGIDAIFQPFFCQNGEQWIMTTPYFQMALNKDLEENQSRYDDAMKVLKVMRSADAQNILCDGQDTLSYSQDVPLRFTEYLSDVRPVVEENHMYIRIASNDFFSASQEVVSKMIAGTYDGAQAYKAFDKLLRQTANSEEDVVLTSEHSYSNLFQNEGGNAAYSVMANSLRSCYGTDVLIASGDSFTGNVLKGEYTEKMAGYMVMPNGLRAYSREMTGEELKETVQAFVAGYEGGLVPFNAGSLPVVSGISMEVTENNGAYTLTALTKDGKAVKDDDVLTVTCLATPKRMAHFLSDESRPFEESDASVRTSWRQYITEGHTAPLAAPENYITLR